MTYTDHYKYTASHLMDDDFRQLRDASTAEKPRHFIVYCRKAIAAKEAGKMPLRDAAYAIAGVMFVRELEEPLFEEITSLAGNLELPEQFVIGDPAQKWQELVALVAKYEKRHQTESWLDEVKQDQAKMEARNTEAESMEKRVTRQLEDNE